MWPNPQFPADLVTFTGEILNGKLYFLCSKDSTRTQCFEISTYLKILPNACSFYWLSYKAD